MNAECKRRTRSLGPPVAPSRSPAVTETVTEIIDAYRTGTAKPEDIVARTFKRIRLHNDPAIFIALREEDEVLVEAEALARSCNKSRGSSVCKHSSTTDAGARRGFGTQFA